MVFESMKCNIPSCMPKRYVVFVHAHDSITHSVMLRLLVMVNGKMIIDGLYAVVGSSNIDRWSLMRMLEANVATVDPAVASQLEEAFMKDIQRSKEITLEEAEV